MYGYASNASLMDALTSIQPAIATSVSTMKLQLPPNAVT